jgi:predicted GNAT family acetyltransferase
MTSDQSTNSDTATAPTADSAADAPIEVRDNPSMSRYEIWVGDALGGFTQYQADGSEVTFIHTESEPAYAGHGLAGQLVRTALDDVRARGLSVLPQCPFVRTFIHRHGEYLDLVPEESRAAFSLP